ncbi:hypothetical protein [Candidimonas nitroreducens]|uniref:hypothetical protein n=1 Tax=Candidimonas nitroreducens TaxID=683354 RepID=UPI001302FB0A|nr:hypothetical protein [Candidimonas nitroreducens]
MALTTQDGKDWFREAGLKKSTKSKVSRPVPLRPHSKHRASTRSTSPRAARLGEPA